MGRSQKQFVHHNQMNNTRETTNNDDNDVNLKGIVNVDVTDSNSYVVKDLITSMNGIKMAQGYRSFDGEKSKSNNGTEKLSTCGSNRNYTKLGTCGKTIFKGKTSGKISSIKVVILGKAKSNINMDLNQSKCREMDFYGITNVIPMQNVVVEVSNKKECDSTLVKKNLGHGRSGTSIPLDKKNAIQSGFTTDN